MDDPRFDAWTRRRFGLLAGGTLAALLGLAESPAAEAKKKRRRRRKRCRKLGQTCDNTKKSKSCCNGALLCSQVSHLGPGNFCCKQIGQECSEDRECCGTDRCNGITNKCQLPET